MADKTRISFAAVLLKRKAERKSPKEKEVWQSGQF
jgi:hypothetical protein